MANIFKTGILADKFMLGTIISTVVVLVLAVFYLTKNPGGSTPANSAQMTEILTVKADDWVRGSATASVTVIEYLDFECEACKVYYPITKQLQAEYKDKVRFVVRYFPLPGHKNSLPSALAAEAAGKQGKFWEMHDILYDNQKIWGEKTATDPALFLDYAKQIGLNLDQYAKDVALSEVFTRVNRDKAEGNSLGISGTPTFFVNGQKIPNPKGYGDFKTFIDGLMPAEK
ncbi:MAG TPA: hypothetical protein DEP87_03100 [Candidatus Pacebacteria bacterium]|nr:hypothetical protein [Candidatus Paceibacterota bacterium]